MNLSRKTLLYSSILSVIIVSLIIGYFILMLPSLYVSYMKERNYSSIVRLHAGYMEDGSYQNLKVENPTGTITVEIPLTGNSFYLVNKFVRVKVDVENQKLQKVLDKLRYYSKHKDEVKNLNEDDFDLEEIKEELLNNKLSEDYPLKFNFEFMENENTFRQISSKVHMQSDDLMVYESNVTDGNNYYTSYIATGVTDEAIDVTFLPVMTPTMEEIRPVVFQSLPMIIAVAVLLVLISSQIFSRMIILPIIKLATHAEFMKEAENLKLEPIPVTGHDEITSLGESLNGLYQKIQESYLKLEEKNLMLAEENKRQEVFLRSSSHQLKTPITAALLLVQGMINEVGKYKNVKEHLPKVKQQLLSMQKIVEDILYLNHCSSNMNPEEVSLPELMEECISFYRIQLEEKLLDVTTEGGKLTVVTDRELLKKILDNLISNAVYFTPEAGRIKIIYKEHSLTITNYGTVIDKELLPHVFDPFVTSVTKNKGHGLGLYVVSYYAKLLHCQVRLLNIDEGVVAELIFE